MAVQAQGVIDEVVWVVGDEAILRSEVEEERLRAQYEGQQIKGDPYCVIPEQMAVQKLFLHQAELDSVEANESSVSHQVDMRLNYYINQIGSKEKMEEYFRKPSSEIREEMMVMGFFPQPLVSAFLDSFRQVGIPSVRLKAVLTETNMRWNSCQLRAELLREEAAFRAQMGKK